MLYPTTPPKNANAIIDSGCSDTALCIADIPDTEPIVLNQGTPLQLETAKK